MSVLTEEIRTLSIEALRAGNEGALSELHALMLRAARFELHRRRQLPYDDAEDLAAQAANDAMVALLGKLDTFRGQSRFTTWAYKFALLEAGVRLRRRAWQERELVLDPDGWARIGAAAPRGPDADAEQSELLGAVASCIRDELTSRQREVLVALAVDGVPIDVLAERLSTTRGALYKTVHDARRKLRAALAARGLPLEDV
jgi:RNA polymerase sigma-70 factor (ECF subfamily)